MENYLLIRTYKDGSQWTITGTLKRISKLHNYCSGDAYFDEIYLINRNGIYKKVEINNGK